MKLDLPIQSETTTLDQAQSVTIDVSKPSERAFTQGLEAVSVPLEASRKRRGYNATYKVCTRCGTEAVDIDDNVIKACSYCKHDNFRITDKLNRQEVENVINQKLRYKCKTCGQTYDQPTTCCLGNYEITNKKKDTWYRGFICSSCRKIYDTEVQCCSTGTMHAGKYKIPSNEAVTRELLGV